MTESNYVSDAEVIADLAELKAAREKVNISDTLDVLVLRADQKVERFDLEKYQDAPTRKTGTVALVDAESFVEYVNRHSLERATTLWGDIAGGRVTAVLDDHCSHEAKDKVGNPGWAQHRAVLTMQATEDWKHWASLDGKLVSQDEFAEHIEAGVDSISTPDPATMLEIAQSFHASAGAHIKSTRNLSGTLEVAYEEKVGATAGQHGTMEIPQTFILGLAPYEGTDPYAVTARFRFRLSDGQLRMGYRLVRPDKVRRAAFDDIVQKVSDGSGFQVMLGTPRS